MGLLDNTVVICIALVYNFFVHYMASTLYKNSNYHEKNQGTNSLLIVAGIAAMVVSKVILKEGQKYRDSVVSKGLMFGGFLLLLTVSLISWGTVSDETRLLITGAGFAGLLFFANKFFDNSSSKQKSSNKKIDK